MLKAAATRLDRPRALPLVGLDAVVPSSSPADDITALPAPSAPKPYDGALDDDADDDTPHRAPPIVLPRPRATARQAAPEAPVPPPAPRKKRRGRLVVVLLLMVLLAGGAAAAAIEQPWRPTVDVPQLVGLTRNEAVGRLQPERLGLKVAGRAPSETVEPGRILTARPARLREGRAVSVTLSSGPEERTLPAVAGRPAEEVTAALTGLGLIVVPNPVDSETVPSGTTLTIDPPAGGRVPRGATVTLGVSAGPPARPLPDLAGKTLDEAMATLTAAGLKGTTVEVFDDKVPSGKVVGTNPAPGTAVRPALAVAINVSKGPDVVTVPSVTGRTPQAAQQAVTAAGLVVSATYGPPSGQVFSTQPSAGAKARRGSSVALYTK